MTLPNSRAPQGGFGKRGNVTLNRPSAQPTPPPEPTQNDSPGFTVPKWAIGAVAAKPAQAPYDFKPAASQSGPTTVARGGFGTTVSSSSGSMFSGG